MGTNACEEAPRVPCATPPAGPASRRAHKGTRAALDGKRQLTLGLLKQAGPVTLQTWHFRMEGIAVFSSAPNVLVAHCLSGQRVLYYLKLNLAALAPAGSLQRSSKANATDCTQTASHLFHCTFWG